MSIKEIKAALEVALSKYRDIVHVAPSPDVKAASDAVAALQKQLADAFTAGASPCPKCKIAPHGIEQPIGKDRVEYEIGCLGCGDSVRGGILPRHAVEAWNEKVATAEPTEPTEPATEPAEPAESAEPTETAGVATENS